jgi:hypothetical protein
MNFFLIFLVYQENKLKPFFLLLSILLKNKTSFSPSLFYTVFFLIKFHP